VKTMSGLATLLLAFVVLTSALANAVYDDGRNRRQANGKDSDALGCMFAMHPYTNLLRCDNQY